MRPKLLVLCASLGCLLLLAGGHTFAQQPGIQYVYDDLGRLAAVVAPDRNVAVYVYDLAGNILAIHRFNLDAIDANRDGIPDPVAIVALTPEKGKVGTPVLIVGKGFSPNAAQNTVSFTGAPAQVNSSTPFSISTSVPSGAATGPIAVTAPLGSAASPTPFTVLGAITVSPASVTLIARGTQQFTAAEAGTAAMPPVTWSVNGIKGGNPAVGTITAEGLYTAPATAPSPPTVTVTATHTDDPTLSASATVSITSPPPGFVTAGSVSVGFRGINIRLDKNVTASVSVQVDAPNTLTAFGGPVSVQVADASAFSIAPAITVTLAPVITTVSPATAAPGTADLLITVTGSGLSGATALTFLLNNSPDGNISVANLAVNAEGTQATATISIAAGAALGGRVVQITTPAGASTPLGTGGNVFTVQ